VAQGEGRRRLGARGAGRSVRVRVVARGGQGSRSGDRAADDPAAHERKGLRSSRLRSKI
jgi:hypothetical protein